MVETEAPDLTRFEQLASRIPESIRLGTSTWNYPGWRGLVYHQDYGPKGAAIVPAHRVGAPELR